MGYTKSEFENNQLQLNQENSKFSSFFISLTQNNEDIGSLSISNKQSGRYYFESENKNISTHVWIESTDGICRLFCEEPLCFVSMTNVIFNQLVLTDQCSLYIHSKEDPDFIVEVIVDLDDLKSESFNNYYILDSTEVTVGSLGNNDIQYTNAYISRNHVRIYKLNHDWYVEDLNSTNGTRLNRKRIKHEKMNIGDEVSLFGLRIIMGINFISINDSIPQLSMNKNKLIKINSVDDFELPAPEKSKNEQIYFNRSPRRRYPLNIPEIQFQSPPMTINNKQIPLVLRLGSSAVMGGRSALMGNYSSLITSLFFPFMTSKYTDKQIKEYEEKRVEKYREYLAYKKNEIRQEIQNEETILNLNYPHLDLILDYIQDSQKLWERRNVDDDFLHVRIGSGTQKIKSPILYEEAEFEMEEDHLKQEMYELVKQPWQIQDVPIMLPLCEDQVVSITGNRKDKMTFIRNLIAQLTLLHSYDELKLVFLLDEGDLDEFSFIKFLPHVWNDFHNFRFIAQSDIESYQISEILKKETEGDLLEHGTDLKSILKKRPFYLVFALSKKLLDNMVYLNEIMEHDQNIGISIITAFDELPKESKKIIQLGYENRLVHIEQIDMDDQIFEVDQVDSTKINTAMKYISNIRLKLDNEVTALPNSLTFLDMYKTGTVEDLHIQDRWKNNNPVKSLSAPIGVGTDGTLFYLDLHEKAHGPHGLIAGSTGSGKSEFIITYILSMAMNYHPDEVTFILIDYKGGGLAGAFEDPIRGIHLPHLVGTITNLDGPSIERSLMSIQSELTRRQKIFNRVKSELSEGTLDIYDYQKLYRNGKVKEPLPHLFIISDEFAELKQQQPEFMDKLISTARIGRSLGVHLVLATQKPSGVVNDQILSNSKFRICLKVQDRSDSMDMIKRTDAADIKQTGRFYLQVGYNDYFAMGQASWCGAPYYPSREIVDVKDESITLIDNIGQAVQTVKPAIHVKEAGKQIVAIVNHLSDLAKQLHIQPKKLWMDPLPDLLIYNDLSHERYKDHITVTIGKIDDPHRQEQYPLTIDLDRITNMMIVGESGSGKSNFIQSMLYAIINQYQPLECQFYGIDPSGDVLNHFSKAVHCGAIIDKNNENNIHKLFEILTEIAKQRRLLFNKENVSSFESYKAIHPIPLILVIIENTAMFSDSEIMNGYYYNLPRYIKQFNNYGIKFILTASHLNEISARIKQELDYVVTFALKDRFDYADALGVKCDYTPPLTPGRGLIVYDERPLEFQGAMIGDFENEMKLNKHIQQKIIELNHQNYDPYEIKRIYSMEEDEEYDHFLDKFTKRRIPLGYSEIGSNLVALPMKQLSNLGIYFGNSRGVEGITQNLIDCFRRENSQFIWIKKSTNTIYPSLSLPEDLQIYDCKEESIYNFWNHLSNEVVRRKEMRDLYCQEHGIDRKDENARNETFHFMYENTKPIIVMIESFHDFCRNKDQVGATDQMMNFLFKNGSLYNVYFVYGVYKEDYNQITGDSLFAYLRDLSTIILSGGNFGKQNLLYVPIQYDQYNTKETTYGTLLVKHREKLAIINMPTGKVIMNEIDEDDLDIF